MFSFAKKKEAAVSSGSEGSSTKPASSVSQEEIKHLEETKYRLFGPFASKKSEKMPSSQQPQISSNAQPQRNGSSSPRPPIPPTKPSRTAVPADDCDNFHPLKIFNIPGLNLPVLNNGATDERILTFNRLPSGKFAFSFRRALAIDRSDDGAVAQRTVVLVEYDRKDCLQDSSGSTSASSLTHGDQLVAINSDSVEQLSREEIVDLIRKVPGNEITLQVKQLNSDTKRTVLFKRQPNGEFGFLLRRSQVVDVYSNGTEQRRTIVLAEPLSQPVHSNAIKEETGSSGLASHHRDQLVAVNGHSVEKMSRDELMELVNRSDSRTIQLTVKPPPLLVSATRQGTVGISGTESEVEDGLYGSGDADLLTVCHQSPSYIGNGGVGKKEETFGHSDDAEVVWLVHRDGYAAGLLVEGSYNAATSGKLRVRLTEVPGEVVIDVDAVDIEKANPSGLDRVDDLVQLLYLNESSVIHLLRQRHASGLIHTLGGSSSILVTKPQVPLSIYADKVVQMFKGCRRGDMPPHVYAVAQQTYRSMIANRRPQAIVLTGRSGSGKTTQLKHLVHYLSLCGGRNNKVLTADKASAVFNVLEAFGNCETRSNKNASRFVTFLTLDFDHVGDISAGLLQCLLLEHSRVVRRSFEKESNFHVFSYLWQGASEKLRTELLLHELENITNFIGFTVNDETECYGHNWARLVASLEALGVSAQEQQTVFSVLAAILHLWAAGATKGIPSYKATFLKPAYAQKAANLLGIAVEELHKNIFINTAQQDSQEQGLHSSQQTDKESSISGGIGNRLAMGRRRVTPYRSGALLAHKLSITDRPGDGVEALEAFIVGLYRETFNLIVSLINRSLSSNYRTISSITLIDCPGYQQGPDRNSSFSEFCFNYVNERLHAFYHDAIFQGQMEVYRQENVTVDFQPPSMSPSSLVDIIDKPMQQHTVKSTNLEARSQEKRGLLWLLDEESIFPGATDESFMERIFVHYNEAGYGKYLTKCRSNRNHFILRHGFGTFPVVYDVSGWVRLAQENPVSRQALLVLQESNKSSVSSLFLTLRTGGIAGGQNAGIGFVENASLRRSTAVLKTLTAPQAMKRKSHCAMLKMQMDYLMENLRRSGQLYFVHCLDCSTEKKARNVGNSADLAVVDVQYLRSQLRSLQITDAVRFDKSGYPERMLFSEFRRRFGCLSAHEKNGVGQGQSSASLLLNDREAAVRLLKETFEADESQATLGTNYVFMKSQFLARLDDQRDQKLSSIVALFQAQCRSYLAKEKLKKRRIQDTAIRCVQKNIDKYLAVRAWPWWRLYTKILPLVGIQKTEDDIKAQQQELEELRAKYKKLEKQYGDLRLHCDRMEARLEESRSEASDERATVTQVTETLEEENKMRLRAEKELAELKASHCSLEKRLQKLESESMEQKKIQLLIGELDEDGDAGDLDKSAKDKLKELRLQLETERKQHEAQKKEESEQLRYFKQKQEKKTAELQSELDETKENLASHRRLVEKSREEAQDLRSHMQQLTVRNADLEKRQRKFDAELQSTKSEVDLERVQKDRLLKEHQTSAGECLRLEAELRKARDELFDSQTKCERLTDDIRVLTKGHHPGRDTEQQLRLQKQTLERKCADQEAELDDLSGEIHQLQQRVTRLEMQNEKLRQESAKESERKEEEFDELRAHHQRRIRMLEEQVDDERHHKDQAQRKVKDLESRLHEAEEAPLFSKDNENQVASLKRQLKKVKALLKDSQLIAEQYERNTANKAALKQLQNELEDVNASKMAAVKIRQNLENELDEIRSGLVAAEAAKSSVEDRCMQLLKERSGLEDRLSDLEQEVQDLLKKYRAQVQQSSVDHITLTDQILRIADLEKENDSLKDQVNELSTQLERKEAASVDKHKMHLAEAKIRQLESKFELESAAKTRADANCAKAKEQLDGLKEQLQHVQTLKERDVEVLKRVQNQHSQQQDVVVAVQRREAESVHKLKELETTVERLEEENARVVSDLKLALRRIDDLQAAMRDDVDLEKAEDDDFALDLYSSEDDDIGDRNGVADGQFSRPNSGSSTHVTC